MSQFAKWALGLSILAIVIFGLSQAKFGGGLTSPDRVSATIGTSASPVTLNNNFTGAGSASSSALKMNGNSDVAIGFSYTPKSWGSKIYIRVDRSFDNGTSYVPYSVIDQNTTSTQVINVNTTGATGTASGVPFVIPPYGVSTSGTAITGSFTLPDLVGDYVKVYVKESTTSTYGTLYLNLFGSNN